MLLLPYLPPCRALPVSVRIPCPILLCLYNFHMFVSPQQSRCFHIEQDSLLLPYHIYVVCFHIDRSCNRCEGNSNLR
jgi:hypothetical protein